MKVKINLYEIRSRKRLSQRQLAELAGIGKSEIANIEAGAVMPRIDTICLLAKALDVSIDDLVQYE